MSGFATPELTYLQAVNAIVAPIEPLVMTQLGDASISGHLTEWGRSARADLDRANRELQGLRAPTPDRFSVGRVGEDMRSAVSYYASAAYCFSDGDEAEGRDRAERAAQYWDAAVNRLDVVKREMSTGTPGAGTTRRGRLDANSSFEEIQAEIDRGKRVAAGGCAVLALVVSLTLAGLIVASA